MSILKYEILKYFNILLMFKKTASLLISIWKTIVNQISHVLWLTCRIKYIKQEILSQRWIWHFYDKTKWFNVEKMSCRPPCYVLLSAAIPANAETICAWFFIFFSSWPKNTTWWWCLPFWREMRSTVEHCGTRQWWCPIMAMFWANHGRITFHVWETSTRSVSPSA